MHWVIQGNLLNEDSMNDLITQLNRQDVPYTVVKVIPFVGMIEPDVNVSGPVFPVGATSMGKLSQKKGWLYFDQNLEYDKLLNNYGVRMLNSDAVIASLREIADKISWDRFHLRPVADNKSFAGTVFDRQELLEWVEKVVALEGKSFLATMTGADLVVASSVKEIYAEYRFHVVDGLFVI